MTFLFTILHLSVYFTWAFLCLLEHCLSPPSLLFPFTITLFSLSLLRKTIFYRRSYFVFVVQKIFGKTSFLICIACLSHPKKKKHYHHSPLLSALDSLRNSYNPTTTPITKNSNLNSLQSHCFPVNWIKIHTFEASSRNLTIIQVFKIEQQAPNMKTKY